MSLCRPRPSFRSQRTKDRLGVVRALRSTARAGSGLPGVVGPGSRPRAGACAEPPAATLLTGQAARERAMAARAAAAWYAHSFLGNATARPASGIARTMRVSRRFPADDKQLACPRTGTVTTQAMSSMLRIVDPRHDLGQNKNGLKSYAEVELNIDRNFMVGRGDIR